MSFRKILAACLLTVALCGCAANRPTMIDERSTYEGLQRIDVKNIDAVYKKADVDLSRYQRLLIRDVDVAFSRGWEDRLDAFRWTAADSERIKSELAKLFAETARQELEQEGGYQIVTEPGPDVLEIRPSIIDLFISAPDVSRTQPGVVRQYTTSAGRMTLVAELRDSLTGEVLARAYDKREDMRSTWWEWTTSVTNTQKARQAISVWADALRDALDRTRQSRKVASR